MTSQKLTPQEVEEAKERIRKIALKNLKAENLMNLASTFLVHESGAYGEGGDSAVEKFKYFPSFNSNLKSNDFKTGEEIDLFRNSILNSRQGNKRYSGNISEYRLMQSCSEIMQESLDKIKISDLYSELMGGSKAVKKELKDIYLGDLRLQISQEEFEKLSDDKQKGIQASQELYKTLVGAYTQYLTDKVVSDSLGERKKSTVKSLEKILVEEK